MANARATILIVEDEEIKRSVLVDGLQDAGYSVVAVANPLEAETVLKDRVFDVVLTDVRMPVQDGISFLRELREQRQGQVVILMTAYGTVKTAVEAMKLGAFDFVEKPFTTEELLLKLDRALEWARLADENEALRTELAFPKAESRIIGQSEAIRAVQATIHALAGADATILIRGESGTGKELAGRVLHETSHRGNGPFTALSCAALPRDLMEAELFGHEAGAFTGAMKRRIGRFELAHGGTLFLDDVDDIPLDLQVKLLRVLQERSFERVGGEQAIRANVRVIAATKRSLASMVAAGTFREDLYYRLNVVPLRIPPLRERLADVPLLVEHFLGRLAMRFNREELGITPAAIGKLEAYTWPGNVRELEHVLERMVALSAGNCLDEHDVPELRVDRELVGLVSLHLNQVSRVAMDSIVQNVESQLVNWALERSGGNLSRAAEMLGIPRTTLQYKAGKLGNVTNPTVVERVTRD